jgi:iron complex transport system ATP-binding protein
MSNDPVLLRTNDLQTGYHSGGKRIVVSGALPELELQPGRLICLLGPNGSGKSTLLRTLAGLQPALNGTIDVPGIEVHKPAELARKISLVLTDRVRGNNLTVQSLIELGRYPYTGWLGVLDEADKAAVEWAIGATGIGALRDRKVHTLSDGESQKMMLARALAQDTPILMLDEPTAHLDLPSRIRLMRLLHQLAGQTRKAILLSTHELDLALQVADVVWLLEAGGRLHQGAPEDLVLNGVFEAAFAEDNIVFDKEAGVFVIHAAPGKPVLLTGGGIAFFWTQRALRRAGFTVVTTPAKELSPDGAELSPDVLYHVRISDHPTRPSWLLDGKGANREYTSIAELLQAMR